MQGKSLAIFIDSFNEIQQQRGQQYGFNQPVYLPLNTGLEKLLEFYGVKVKKSYLMDEACFVNPGNTNMEQMPIYYAPQIMNENINHEFPFLNNIKQLFMYKNSPLEANEEKIKTAGLKLHTLISSSAKSWEMSGRINLMPMFIRPPADEKEKKSMPLAYLMEGEFPSYFADKPIPEKPKKDESVASEAENIESEKKKQPEQKQEIKKSQLIQEKNILKKGRPGRILVMGSSEILKNNIIDQNGLSPNAVFLLNSIDYLNGNENMAVMRGKNQRFNPIKETKLLVRRLIKTVNGTGLPLAIIILGIFIWMRRKARKKSIQAMFAK